MHKLVMEGILVEELKMTAADTAACYIRLGPKASCLVQGMLKVLRGGNLNVFGGQYERIWGAICVVLKMDNWLRSALFDKFLRAWSKQRTGGLCIALRHFNSHAGNKISEFNEVHRGCRFREKIRRERS